MICQNRRQYRNSYKQLCEAFPLEPLRSTLEIASAQHLVESLIAIDGEYGLLIDQHRYLIELQNLIEHGKFHMLRMDLSERL
jgi:hypothetical protein